MAIRIDTTPEGTNNFDFVTNKLGRITIQDFRIFRSSKFITRRLIEGNSTNELLFRNLLLDIGRKYDSPKKNAKKLKLTRKDVLSIENGELEQIACKFLESNKVSLENIDPGQPLKKDNETYVDCLVRLFKKQQENWNQATKIAVSDFQSPIEFSASRLTDLRRQLDDNLVISGQLGHLLSFHRPEFDDALTVSSQIAKSAESNPSITTIANQVNRLSPIIETTAALIKSLNDTSLAVAAKFSKNARTSFQVGFSVLIIAIFTLILPYFINPNRELLDTAISISEVLNRDADSTRNLLDQTNSELRKVQKKNAELSVVVDSLKTQIEIIILSNSRMKEKIEAKSKNGVDITNIIGKTRRE